MIFVKLTTAPTMNDPGGRTIHLNMTVVTWMEAADNFTQEDEASHHDTNIHTTDMRQIWRVTETIEEILRQINKKGKL